MALSSLCFRDVVLPNVKRAPNEKRLHVMIHIFLNPGRSDEGSFVKRARFHIPIHHKSMKRRELLNAAKVHNIRGRSKMKKEALIDALLQVNEGAHQ